MNSSGCLASLRPVTTTIINGLNSQRFNKREKIKAKGNTKMDGVLYKIDKAKKRLTDNIIAELDGCNEQIWFTSKNMPLLNLDKGDFVHFSANDMPINNDYEVLQVLLNMISCKRL